MAVRQNIAHLEKLTAAISRTIPPPVVTNVTLSFVFLLTRAYTIMSQISVSDSCASRFSAAIWATWIVVVPWRSEVVGCKSRKFKPWFLETWLQLQVITTQPLFIIKMTWNFLHNLFNHRPKTATQNTCGILSSSFLYFNKNIRSPKTPFFLFWSLSWK